DFLLRLSDGQESPPLEEIFRKVDFQLVEKLGSERLLNRFFDEWDQNLEEAPAFLNSFLSEQKDSPYGGGSLFVKQKAVENDQRARTLLEKAEGQIEGISDNEAVLTAFKSNIDELLKNFTKGESLFFSQACYGCHRIEGLARGGIG